MQLIDVRQLNQQFQSLSLQSQRHRIRIVCISDTHGRHSWLTKSIPDGDILIHCGDITFQGYGGVQSVHRFNTWMAQFTHRYKIIMGGNHDRFMPSMDYVWLKKEIFSDCIYLDNDNVCIQEFGDLVIFGSAWSPKGSDNNAFQELNEKMKNIGKRNIDILLGHSDLSDLHRYYRGNSQIVDAIASSVRKCRACVHLCGHFHARYGVKIREHFYDDDGDMMIVNCSSLDGRYVPTHWPVVFDLEYQA